MSNRNAVFVIERDRTPCNPVHPAVARKLLSEQKAAVFRRYPFTIILKEKKSDNPQSLRLKIDPGARYTGLALVSDKNIVWAAELVCKVAKTKCPVSAAVIVVEIVSKSLISPTIITSGFWRKLALKALAKVKVSIETSLWSIIDLSG